MQDTNTKHRAKRSPGKRRHLARTVLLLTAVFVIGLLALTAVQFAGNSGWSKDVEATSAGMTVRLQFKAEQNDQGTMVLARVRDTAGFLMQVDSAVFSVTSDGDTVWGPEAARPSGVFSSTGDGRYAAAVGGLAEGAYEATLNVRHGQSTFTASWPFEVQ